MLWANNRESKRIRFAIGRIHLVIIPFLIIQVIVESRIKDEDGKDVRLQLEIDFIATLGSKKYYIQSAYAIPDREKYEQETLSFDKTKDSFKKIIIVEKSMKPRYDEKGYLVMGVKEFLLDSNSLSY